MNSTAVYGRDPIAESSLPPLSRSGTIAHARCSRTLPVTVHPYSCRSPGRGLKLTAMQSAPHEGVRSPCPGERLLRHSGAPGTHHAQAGEILIPAPTCCSTVSNSYFSVKGRFYVTLHTIVSSYAGIDTLLHQTPVILAAGPTRLYLFPVITLHFVRAPSPADAPAKCPVPGVCRTPVFLVAIEILPAILTHAILPPDTECSAQAFSKTRAMCIARSRSSGEHDVIKLHPTDRILGRASNERYRPTRSRRFHPETIDSSSTNRERDLRILKWGV